MRTCQRRSCESVHDRRRQPKLSLRPFLAADIGIIAEIFRASVDELAAEDTAMAAGAWIAVADDEENSPRLVASSRARHDDGSPSALPHSRRRGGDMLYVHPAAAGMASVAVIEALEKLAAARRAPPDRRWSDSAQDSSRARFVPRRAHRPARWRVAGQPP